MKVVAHTWKYLGGASIYTNSKDDDVKFIIFLFYYLFVPVLKQTAYKYLKFSGKWSITRKQPN